MAVPLLYSHRRGKSSVQLMLSMGNPYGQGRAGSEDEKTKVYDNSVLSKGTVFFDNVKVTTLDKEEFEEKCARKAEDGKDGEYYIGNEVFHVYEMVYANMFAYKVLSYATDSFDSYTENTVTEEFDTDGEYNEGFYRGTSRALTNGQGRRTAPPPTLKGCTAYILIKT